MDNDKELKKLREYTLDLYKRVLAGKKRWPNGYWTRENAKERAAICIRYSYENYYKNSKHINTLKGLPKSFFTNKALGTMLNTIFNGDTLEATAYSIPEFKEQLNNKLEHQINTDVHINDTVNREDLNSDTLQLYKRVLFSGMRWPNGYWSEPDAKLNAIICMKYLYDLKYTNKAVDSFYGLPLSFFVNNGLGNMLKIVFNGDKREATACIIPEFKEQYLKYEKQKRKMEEKRRIEEEAKRQREELLREMERAHIELLHNDEYRRDILKKVLATLNCDIEEIPSKINIKLISDCNLERLFKEKYDSKFYKLVEDAFPGVFKPWEFAIYKKSDSEFLLEKITSKYAGEISNNSHDIDEDYWTIKENRLYAFAWICNLLIKIQGRDVYSIRAKDFYKYGLGSLLEYYDNLNGNNIVPVFFGNREAHCVTPAFNEFKPHLAKPWLFEEETRTEYWKNNEHLVTEALNYVLEKNNITKENILQLSRESFRNAHLLTLLDSRYDSYIFKAVNELYPNEFDSIKWLFKDIPQEAFSSKAGRKDAFMWLLSRINLSVEDADKIQPCDFIDNNLGYLFNEIYKGSVFLALNDIFPGKYSMDNERLANQSPISSTYEDSFGKYEKIEFISAEYEDNKHILDEISNIFIPNPNSWVGGIKSIPFRDYLDETCTQFIRMVMNGEIEIFKYDIKHKSISVDNTVEETDCNLYSDEELEEMSEEEYEGYLDKTWDNYCDKYKFWDNYCDEYEKSYNVKYIGRNNYSLKHSYKKLLQGEWEDIMEMARVKSNNLFEIYSAAHKFFLLRNLHLNPTSIYMDLQKEVYLPSNYYYWSGDIDEDTFPINKKDPVYHYNSLVRCGEVELYRILDEASRSKADYVWAFPFDYDYREDGRYAYLIHFNPGVADNLIGVTYRFHYKESKFI